ncbi:MAG: hypothetical protein E7247_04055 [Paenibacillaceae bacterium]|nr:hypothetical protein [Paenibacillaceae bacterium]
MWDWITVLLYSVIGWSGYFCVYKQKRIKRKIKIYYVAMSFIWIPFAVFRYVGLYKNISIGGSDAPTYISYFQVCLTSTNHLYALHTEALFQIINKIVRLFTDDYHWLFILFYGFIFFAYVSFIQEFGIKHQNYIPIFMLIIPYIKSFSTIRTGLAIAAILIGIVSLSKRKILLCFFMMLSSIFIQRASLIYATFPVFYYLVIKEKITQKNAILFSIIGAFSGVIIQRVLIAGDFSFMSGGAYSKYILQSFHLKYWIDYLKIIAEQIVVLIMVFVNNARIKKFGENLEMEEKRHIKILQILCYYDCFLLPICATLNIWRGVDYFFLPRLLMLGLLITIYGKKVTYSSKRIYSIIVLIFIIMWYILRLSTFYDKSDVMPYLFSF